MERDHFIRHKSKIFCANSREKKKVTMLLAKYSSRYCTSKCEPAARIVWVTVGIKNREAPSLFWFPNVLTFRVWPTESTKYLIRFFIYGETSLNARQTQSNSWQSQITKFLDINRMETFYALEKDYWILLTEIQM